MALVRWTPWQELEHMQRQLSRVLEDVHSPVSTDYGEWAPTVDIRETDDAILVQAELPGIEKKDVHLEVKDRTLTISGERKYEKDVKEENVHRIERAYGRFVRSFSLPNNVDTTKVDATMTNGVLEVKLPKVEGAKAREISIQ